MGAFFHEIGVAVGNADTSKEGKKRAAKWKAYGTYLSLGASLAKSLKTVLPHTPQQILPEYGGKKAYQSQIEVSGKRFLLRAIVADDVDPAIVVIVYRTSKLAKYWRKS
jgi:hypothetical protein